MVLQRHKVEEEKYEEQYSGYWKACKQRISDVQDPRKLRTNK